MSKLLELEFDCRAPIVDAFIIKPSQIPELQQEQDVAGYDWIASLQDFHSHAYESLCHGVDIDGCTVSAKLGGEIFPISGVLVTEMKKDLSDPEYTEELETLRYETPLEEFIESVLISDGDVKDSGSDLNFENGDYLVVSFTETKYSKYQAFVKVDDNFSLHDIDLEVRNFDGVNKITDLLYFHPETQYVYGDRTSWVELPLISVKYKGRTFAVESDFTSYAPIFECYKYENGEFLPTDELNDIFHNA